MPTESNPFQGSQLAKESLAQLNAARRAEATRKRKEEKIVNKNTVIVSGKENSATKRTFRVGGNQKLVLQLGEDKTVTVFPQELWQAGADFVSANLGQSPEQYMQSEAGSVVVVGGSQKDLSDTVVTFARRSEQKNPVALVKVGRRGIFRKSQNFVVEALPGQTVTVRKQQQLSYQELNSVDPLCMIMPPSILRAISAQRRERLAKK